MHAELKTLLQNLELELLRHDVRKSVSRLKELFADDFFEIGSSGIVYSREDIMKQLPNPGETKYSIYDFRATEIGPETMLVTYRTGKQTKGSRELSWSMRSSIWQKRNGRWVIVFHQGTPTGAL
jgi:glyoxylase I family protein